MESGRIRNTMRKFPPTSSVPSAALLSSSVGTGIPLKAWPLPDSFLLSPAAAGGLEEPAPSTDIMNGGGVGTEQVDAKGRG